MPGKVQNGRCESSSFQVGKHKLRRATLLQKELTGFPHGTRFGHGQRKHAMKLNESMKIWCPVDQPEYLLILKQGQRPPQTREFYLLEATSLLAQLVEEASKEEKEEANRQMKWTLPEEVLLWVPPGGFHNRKTSQTLLTNPAQEGGKLHSWKVGIDQALISPQMSKEQAEIEAKELTLESFLSRLL